MLLSERPKSKPMTPRWHRFGAFVAGLALLVAFLVLNPFAVLPDPLAAALTALPVTCCIYGISGQSWRSAAGIGLGTAIGMGIGTYLRGSGLL